MVCSQTSKLCRGLNDAFPEVQAVGGQESGCDRDLHNAHDTTPRNARNREMLRAFGPVFRRWSRCTGLAQIAKPMPTGIGVSVEATTTVLNHIQRHPKRHEVPVISSCHTGPHEPWRLVDARGCRPKRCGQGRAIPPAAPYGANIGPRPAPWRGVETGTRPI